MEVNQTSQASIARGPPIETKASPSDASSIEAALLAEATSSGQSESLVEVHQALEQLETRRLLWVTSGVCCFDMSSYTNRCWRVHKLCARCSVLNRLMIVVARDGSNVAYNMVSQTLVSTDCISQNKRIGTTPKLPTEIILAIVHFGVDDLRTSKDGSLVCALLHTSSLIRSDVQQRFAQVQLLEVDTEYDTWTMNEVFPACVLRAVQTTLVNSTARRSNDSDCVQPLAPLEVWLGRGRTELAIAVMISIDETMHADDDTIKEWVLSGCEWVSASYPHVPTVQEAERQLFDTLRTVPPLRSTTPFVRDCENTLGPPRLSAEVSVTMRLSPLISAEGEMPYYEHEWIFQTVPADGKRAHAWRYDESRQSLQGRIAW